MNEQEIIVRGNTARREIALTFDDGPNPVYTPEMMSILEEVSGKATFFMIGEQMEASPSIAEAVAARGHEIGNHTYSHPYLTRLNRDECEMELKRTDVLITKLTGRRPLVFRPPFFDYNHEVAKLAARAGYGMIGALNTAAKDWEQPGVEHIVEKSLECAENGSIMLFHDGFGDRSQTVEAVRRLTRKLSADGFRFVTVSELLRDS